jgi:DNA (cytosine-5)-methyltransferase 1
VDLFAGAGGLALGFASAGCEVTAAVDIDAVAGDTFLRNFSRLQPASSPLTLAGREFSLENVDFLKDVRVAPPDILIGGPPCQAFSRLGRGKLDSLREEGFKGDPRNELYRGFLAMLAHWRPRAVVMENVPGMLSVKGVNYADRVARELAQAGYRVGYAVLNSVWYGVPQYRERLFFLGYRDDLGIRPATPSGTHRAALPEGYRRPRAYQQPGLFDGLEWHDHEGELPVRFIPGPLPAVTVRDALVDLPPLMGHLAGQGIPRGDFRQRSDYRCPADTDYARLMRGWPGLPVPTAVVDHVVRRTPRDYETFCRMKPGDRYPEAYRIACQRFDEELARLRGSGRAPKEGSHEWNELRARFVPPYPVTAFDDKWRKLIPDLPSWTVPAHLAKDSYSHIHYDDSQARMISVREAARLQSFPDNFLFSGNMGESFRQIGNAVPPLLAWAIAECVLKTLGHVPVPAPRGATRSAGNQASVEA